MTRVGPVLDSSSTPSNEGVMLSSDTPTRKEGDFLLRVLRQDQDMVEVQCEGEVRLPDFRPDDDPLVKLLGTQACSRKVLLDLDRATALDTSGISWLVSCHERFQNAGGVLVLHSVPPRLSLVLKLLHLEQVLETAADLPTARARAAREMV
jgi:anti-anti-sigma regulatory factor